MPDIDRLDIKIESDSQKAEQAISKLIDNLKDLKKVFSSLDKDDGMKSVAKETENAEKKVAATGEAVKKIAKDAGTAKKKIAEAVDSKEVDKSTKAVERYHKALRKVAAMDKTPVTYHTGARRNRERIKAQIDADIAATRAAEAAIPPEVRAQRDAEKAAAEARWRQQLDANIARKHAWRDRFSGASAGAEMAEKELPATKGLTETTNAENENASATEKTASAWERFKSVISSAKEVLGNIGGVVRSGFSAAVSAATPVVSKLAGALGYLAGRFVGFNINAVRKSFLLFASGVRKAAGAVAELTGRLLGLPFRPLTRQLSRFGGGVGEAVGNASKAFNHGFKTIIKYVFGFRSLMYAYRALRGSIAEGFTNLAHYSDQTNANLSLLTSRLNQVKNGLATAFDPILSYITPIIDTLLSYIMTAINALAQFFAILTGQSTWKKATLQMNNFASGANESAKGSDNAKKSADELKKSLMGFDKINKLDDPDKSSSGGSDGGNNGGSGKDYSGMFSTENVDTGISNFAKMVQDAWRDADFTEVGNIIGTKLTTALNSIPWDTIKPLANNFGKSFATFINGLLSAEGLAEAVGKTIGESVNTLFTLANGFVTNISDEIVGTFFADSMNAGVDTIDWQLIANTLSEAANKVFGIAETWTDKFEFKKLATEIGNTVADTLNGIQWVKAKKAAENFGTKLGDAIGGVLEAHPLTAVGNAIKNALDVVLTGAEAFTANIPWSTVGEDLANGMNEVLTDESLWKKAAKTIKNTANGVFELAATWSGKFKFGDMGDAIKSAITTTLNGLKWEDAETAVKNIAKGIATALNNVMTEDTFNAVGSAIAGGINTAVAGAKEFVDEISWSDWGSSIASGVNTFFKDVKWKEAGVTFSDAVGGLLDLLAEAFGEIEWETVGSNVADAIAAIKWDELFKKAAKLIDVGITALVEFAGGLFKGLAEAIGQWLDENLPEELKKAFETANQIADFLGGWTDEGEQGRKDSPARISVEADITKANDKTNGTAEINDATGNMEKSKDKTNGNATVNKATANVETTADKTNGKTIIDKAKATLTEAKDNIVNKVFGGFTSKVEEARDEVKNKLLGGFTAKTEKADTTGIPADQKIVKDAAFSVNSAVDHIPGEQKITKDYKAIIGTYDEEKKIDKKKTGFNAVIEKFTEITKIDKVKSGFEAIIDEYKEKKKIDKKKTGFKAEIAKYTEKDKIDKLKKKFKAEIAKYTEKKKIDKSKTGFSAQLKNYTEKDGINKTKSGFTGVLKYLSDGLTDAQKTIKVTAKVKKLDSSTAYGTSKLTQISGGAKGTAIYGGAWHNLPQYATGGAPSHGTLFFAGEAGAETVGHINGRTEVLNQSQMASVMYTAVVNGMMQALAANPNQTQVIIEGDANKMFRVIQKEANNYTNMTGRPAFNY